LIKSIAAALPDRDNAAV